MPIQLTTPLTFNPGRGKPAENYAQAKIVGFESIIEPAEHASVTIRVQYGDTVEGAWVAGKAAIEYVLIQDTPAKLGDFDPETKLPIETEPAGTKYTDWVTSTHATSTSNLLYAEVALALYLLLLSAEDFEGTIV
jgi:hypothetical protein